MIYVKNVKFEKFLEKVGKKTNILCLSYVLY